MKVLIISAGLSPKHGGGLPAYLGETIPALIEHGHQIVYLDPHNVSDQARVHFDFVPGNPAHYLLYNTGMVETFGKGTRDPLRQVRASNAVKRCLSRILVAESPDVIHLHELIGFPVDAFATLARRGVPVVFTAHDYYGLCPTIKLFHKGDYLCNKTADELDCEVCCEDALPYTHTRSRQLLPALSRRPRLRVLGDRFLDAVKPAQDTRRDYVLRRNEMVVALNSIDRVICISKIQRDLFLRSGIRPEKIELMTLGRRTIRNTPPPSRMPRKLGPLVLFASNIYSVEKGMRLVEREFALLRSRNVPVELRIYGDAAPKLDNSLISVRGSYSGSDLDRICQEADFGLIPSIWWEAYGYIGGEMLTRGLPVLASSVGAMGEYVHHEHNGLIFSTEEGGLASAVERLVSDPALRDTLTGNASKSYSAFEAFDQHILRLESFYDGLVAARLVRESDDLFLRGV